MKNRTASIEFRGIEVDVDYYFDEGDPGVHTYSNGDPGYPPTPPEFSVERVWAELPDVKGNKMVVDISSFLMDDDFTDIEDEICYND